MVLHADISPQGCARLDKLALVVSSADAKGFCAVGWFTAGAMFLGAMCYPVQEQEVRCHYISIQTEHPNGNFHRVSNKSNLYFYVGWMSL